MERIEEYLEAIYDIQKKERKVARTTNLAKKLDVKPSSVTEMLSKLSELGYIEYTPYKGAILTKKGEEIAKRIKKYHKIFEAFFTDFLGIDKEEAHRLSCELEHHVNDEIAMKVCSLIANKCSFCEDCNFKTFKLLNAPSGKYRVVAAPTALHQIGIMPGVEIEVVNGDVIIKDSKISIDKKLLSMVLLERTERTENSVKP